MERIINYLRKYPGFLGHILGDSSLELFYNIEIKSVRFTLLQKPESVDYLHFILNLNSSDFYGFEQVKIYDNLVNTVTPGDAVALVEEQEKLAKFCRKLDKKGVKFIVSNAPCKEIEKLYKGFHMKKF